MSTYFCHFQPKPFFCLPISNAPDEAPSTDQGTEDPKSLHLFSAEFVTSLPLPPACLLMRWLKRTSSYDLQCCLPRQIFSLFLAGMPPYFFLISSLLQGDLTILALRPCHRVTENCSPPSISSCPQCSWHCSSAQTLLHPPLAQQLSSRVSG